MNSVIYIIRRIRYAVHKKRNDLTLYGIGSTAGRSSSEFGRDTNRLDYFPLSPLDVLYDSETEGSSSYGGGSSIRDPLSPLNVLFDSETEGSPSYGGGSSLRHQQQTPSTAIHQTRDLCTNNGNRKQQHSNSIGQDTYTLGSLHGVTVINTQGIASSGCRGNIQHLSVANDKGCDTSDGGEVVLQRYDHEMVTVTPMVGKPYKTSTGVTMVESVND